MTSAVDTNVLFDVLIPGAAQGPQSVAALAAAAQLGTQMVSPVVYGELSPHFPSRGPLDAFLRTAGISVKPFNRRSLFLAGQRWRTYRQAQGPTICPTCGVALTCPACTSIITMRLHVIADFLIGAHAVMFADRLITRDRGYYAAYFPELTLLVP